MAALSCGEEGAPGGAFYRARAWPELRGEQEGPRGTAARFKGFGARGWKEKVVSEAEGIKRLNVRTIGGDVAGFVRLWKVFKFESMAAAGEKGKERTEKKERRKTTRARLILNGRLRCNEAQPLDLDLTAAIN